MLRTTPRRVAAAAISGVVALAMVAVAAAPASAATPGEPTITLPINDSEAGGTYDQDFTRVYDGSHPGRHARLHLRSRRARRSTGPRPPASRASTPPSTTTPATSSRPVRTRTCNDYVLTQAQIDYMGDQLANQIVAVDEEHYGPMGAADPAEPASDSLVMVVYNVQDANYYDCAETTYTAGYFAPDYIDSSGMNVIVIDAFDWANRVGPDESEWNDDDPANDQPTLYEGVIAHELEHLLRTTATPASFAGSTRDSPTSRCSSTATTSAART